MRLHLHPSIDSRARGMLPVTGGHSLYWEECGNPTGKPVVFLHGGPGSGCTPTHRRFFDPAFYRIILFDQRGAGRSTPYGSIEHNTTPDLVADMERLREHLSIERWMVFGGLWGSTLALAYGETHPEKCLGFVLRGIFMGRPEEIDWFLHGMGTFVPEAASDFRNFLPEAERDTLLESYYHRLTDPDPAIHLPAARVWSAYEGQCSTLMPNPDTTSSGNDGRSSLSLARIEAHYMRHKIFLPSNDLLNNAHRLRHLPAIIVQGRYDLVCPPATAFALKDEWPEAEMIMVPDAGHSAMEPGILTQLVAATQKMKRLISALIL